jgi:hypothetical protein
VSEGLTVKGPLDITSNTFIELAFMMIHPSFFRYRTTSREHTLCQAREDKWGHAFY